ncbi:MAG: DNA mismatch repair endonuclease MutL, partial [Flavobacteriaceae bacterium]|nr:DNA mismatch repair endonuclease MutL [Flavobacteriaceae bacterium]
MADIIQLLPDHVANQIAAGEVVQRPASVVKELMENAIDAGATEIRLIVKNAGKILIQIVDNGIGMSTTDARLSLERHATSKIRSADDLFNIHTKGFRGEALASIAAIAHLEMKSRRTDDEVGTSIIVEGSKVLSQEAAVTPVGTSVSVKNLFYNVPARRNFLKSDQVELRHIIDEFHRVAMAHSNVEFKFHHNESELFNLPLSNIRQRIVNIFGGKTNEKLVPVKEETEMVKIEGFVGKPEFSKKTRGEQFFFVNDRFIKSPYLNHAVSSAYEGLLKDGYHASYFLFLKVDPQSIDVNIHPTKTEIKFEDEHSLYAILRSSIKHSLGQFSIAPVLDFERDSNMDTPYAFKNKDVSQPRIEVDKDYNPFRSKSEQASKSWQKSASAGQWESLYVGLRSEGGDQQKEGSSFEFESDALTSPLFGEEDTKLELKTFQIHNKFIVKAIKSGLLVINQNRAHQRVLYESYLERITVKEGVSQQLLFPKKLGFSSNEIKIIEDLTPQLVQAGFILEISAKDEIQITGMPVEMNEDELELVLQQLIRDVEDQVPGHNFSLSDLIAKSLSSSLSIKTGKKLSVEEQEYLVDKLFSCKEPNISPFNVTTFITLGID